MVLISYCLLWCSKPKDSHRWSSNPKALKQKIQHLPSVPQKQKWNGLVERNPQQGGCEETFTFPHPSINTEDAPWTLEWPFWQAGIHLSDCKIIPTSVLWWTSWQSMLCVPEGASGKPPGIHMGTGSPQGWQQQTKELWATTFHKSASMSSVTQVGIPLKIQFSHCFYTQVKHYQVKGLRVEYKPLYFKR